MAKVVADLSMSLDGFVADPSDGVEHLFGWYSNGDVTVPTAESRLQPPQTPQLKLPTGGESSAATASAASCTSTTEPRHE